LSNMRLRRFQLVADEISASWCDDHLLRWRHCGCVGPWPSLDRCGQKLKTQTAHVSGAGERSAWKKPGNPFVRDFGASMEPAQFRFGPQFSPGRGQACNPFGLIGAKLDADPERRPRRRLKVVPVKEFDVVRG
jgi:hypothetical protein